MPYFDTVEDDKKLIDFHSQHWTGTTQIIWSWNFDRKWHTVSEIREHGSDPVPVAKFIDVDDARGFAEDLSKDPETRWLWAIQVE